MWSLFTNHHNLWLVTLVRLKIKFPSISADFVVFKIMELISFHHKLKISPLSAMPFGLRGKWHF